VLPDEGYQFLLGGQVTDAPLREQLDKLKEFMDAVSDLRSDEVTATEEQDVRAFGFLHTGRYR